jgi:competence protein ComEC
MALDQALRTHVAGEAGALVSALVLGNTTRPDADLVAAHRATGLSHLLAVSGAHAAMLAFLLGLCTWHGRPRVGRSGRTTAVVLALLIAYAAITGCEPPVLRAIVAYTLGAAARWLGRPCGVAPSMLAPAILTAFVQPEALLGPSFLLSYAAVAGLVLAGPPRGDSFVARWLVLPLRTSVWATLLTAPLTLWFFGQLAPWTVLLTPLLAPLVGLLLLLGLGTALAGVTMPPLATVLALPTEWIAGFYTDLVHAADRLPGTPIPATCSPPPWTLLLAVLAAVTVILVWRHRHAVAGAAALLSLPHFLPANGPTHARFVLCAVGHGQAALATTPTGHQTAIDCGSLQSPLRAADALVAELQARRLDLLVVTHGDVDHQGGILSLLGRVRVAHTLVPEGLAASPLVASLRAHGSTVEVVAAGQTCAPVPHLRVWAPPLPTGAAANDRSLWVHLDVAGTSVLLTGDAQELGVAAALQHGFASPHDVLVLPHHGRANANAPALLQQVRPRACLASSPAADADTRLGELVRRTGAERWCTGLHGTLTLRGESPHVHGDTGARPLPARR